MCLFQLGLLSETLRINREGNKTLKVDETGRQDIGKKKCRYEL